VGNVQTEIIVVLDTYGQVEDAGFGWWEKTKKKATNLVRTDHGRYLHELQETRSTYKEMMDILRDQNDYFRFTKVPEAIHTAMKNFKLHFLRHVPQILTVTPYIHEKGLQIGYTHTRAGLIVQKMAGCNQLLVEDNDVITSINETSVVDKYEHDLQTILEAVTDGSTSLKLGITRDNETILVDCPLHARKLGIHVHNGRITGLMGQNDLTVGDKIVEITVGDDLPVQYTNREWIKLAERVKSADAERVKLKINRARAAQNGCGGETTCKCHEFPVFNEWKQCDERFLNLSTVTILGELRRVQKKQEARMVRVEQENVQIRSQLDQCLTRLGMREFLPEMAQAHRFQKRKSRVQASSPPLHRQERFEWGGRRLMQRLASSEEKYRSEKP